jgi:hypothetical protein
LRRVIKTHLLVEDRSGLTSITLLLTDVTSLSQGVVSPGTSFVDTNLVGSVLLAAPSAQGVLFLGNVYHAEKDRGANKTNRKLAQFFPEEKTPRCSTLFYND